jgi:hypothetical protein
MTTVSWTEADRRPPLSTSVTLHTLVPNASAAGVKDSVPMIDTRGGVVNMLKFTVLLQDTVNASPLSVSPGPAEIAVAQLFCT